MIEPLSSSDLARILREHDIFITASKTDPCSNSVVEALSCGLPAVALHDGGHPELIDRGGKTFKGTHDVLEIIDRVAQNLATYKQQLPHFDIQQTAKSYIDFAERIKKEIGEGKAALKRSHTSDLIQLKRMILFWKFKKTWMKLRGFMK